MTNIGGATVRRLPGLTVALAALGLLAVLAGCAHSSTSANRAASAATGQHLSVAAFAGLASAPGTVVLDVRTPAEFASSHLARAVNVDVEAADFSARLGALNKSATYAVYCHSGNRSAAALGLMASAGFAHASDLAGGISAWLAAGQPVVAN
jgi:rhodanese-related sulfurtransferase